ncbi:MAG: lysozyme inhibitor LprI family protein [Allorhizobium sp.]
MSRPLLFTCSMIAGALLSLLSGTSAANAASFDCNAESLKADEKVICENRDLNDADVRMVTTFELLGGFLAMGSRGALQDEQVAWLKTRQACEADIECLKAVYAARMAQFSALVDKIERPL